MVLSPAPPRRIPPRAQSTSRQVSPITFSGRLIAPCMVGLAQPRVSPKGLYRLRLEPPPLMPLFILNMWDLRLQMRRSVVCRLRYPACPPGYICCSAHPAADGPRGGPADGDQATVTALFK